MVRPSSDLTGQRFGRLLLIGHSIFINGRKAWVCICDCGNAKTVMESYLKNGDTKSCGCLKIDADKKKSAKLIAGRRQFEPRIASAHFVWRMYFNRDHQCVDFDTFLKISQENCFYCGIIPSKTVNHFASKSISKVSSKHAIEQGNFVYNGLDRVNNDGYHTIDNIVPCCFYCNISKRDHSIEYFLNWIHSVKITEFYPIEIEHTKLPDIKRVRAAITDIYKSHYNDADLTIEEVYWLSQQNCFYCNAVPNNKYCGYKKRVDFIYNGIDRIDNLLSHSKNNVVPCCANCNYSKRDRTLEDFNKWIKRIQDYQRNLR